MATRKSKRTPDGKEAQKSRKPVTKGSKFQQPNRCGIMDCVLIIRPPRRPVARYQLYVYQTARGIYSAKEIREAYQATRIIDNVPAIIDVQFLRPFANSLQANLIHEFKLVENGVDAKCAEYLTEDATVVSTRADLVNRVAMLEVVQKSLINFS
ncbi:hypothetical protein B0H13DRAFT_2525331 [Mycena leptocephala]|nr:hypothetical protein B0H13DRAFT_2525331 [Mycena leptocephala]